MNREIKFRAWDGKNMIEWKVFESFADDTYYLIWNNEMPIMQFTGLTDKNGVEIYEGDIVKLNNGGAEALTIIKSDKFHEIILEIKRWVNDRDEGTVEVIGNIYENSNLTNL